MRTTINLPPKLLEETKVQAKANNVTLSSYVEEAVRAALKKEARISALPSRRKPASVPKTPPLTCPPSIAADRL